MKIYMYALHGVLGIIFAVPGFRILEYQLVFRKKPTFLQSTSIRPTTDNCNPLWSRTL